MGMTLGAPATLTEKKDKTVRIKGDHDFQN